MRDLLANDKRTLRYIAKSLNEGDRRVMESLGAFDLLRSDMDGCHMEPRPCQGKNGVYIANRKVKNQPDEKKPSGKGSEEEKREETPEEKERRETLGRSKKFLKEVRECVTGGCCELTSGPARPKNDDFVAKFSLSGQDIAGLIYHIQPGEIHDISPNRRPEYGGSYNVYTYRLKRHFSLNGKKTGAELYVKLCVGEENGQKKARILSLHEWGQHGHPQRKGKKKGKKNGKGTGNTAKGQAGAPKTAQ